jgi:hypothetical protein
MKNDIRAQGFIGFMVSKAGRWLRVVIGVLLVAWCSVTVTVGVTLVATLGFIIFADAALDFFIIGPLFSAPIRGAVIRRELRHERLEEASP